MDGEEVQMDSFWREILNQDPGEMNLEAVTSALQQGAPVDGDEGALLTPLQHAAHTSNLRLARILCDFNASLELPARLHEGCTAMHLATRAGNEDMVLLLVAMGARVDAKDDKGRTPLHFAAEAGYNAIVDLLLSYEAPADVRDAAGHTPVLYAAREGHTHILETLSAHGCSLHTLDQDGATPLHLAAERGHLRTVCMLLVSGVSPGIEDSNRCKAEDRALRRGWTVVVDLLQHPQDASDILEQFALEERAGGDDDDDNLQDSLDDPSEVESYLEPDDRTASGGGCGMEPELSAFDDNTRVEPSSPPSVDIDVEPDASGLAEAINDMRLDPLGLLAALFDNGPESFASSALDDDNDPGMSFLTTADVSRVAESCIEQEHSYRAGDDDKSPDLLRFDDGDDVGTCNGSSASSAVGDSVEAGSPISTCGAGNMEQRSLPIARSDSMEAQTLCLSSGDDDMEPEPSCLSSGDDDMEPEPSCLSSGDDGVEPEPSCLFMGDDGLEQEHNVGCSVNTEPNGPSAFGGEGVVEQQSPANTSDSCTTGDPPGRGSGDPGVTLSGRLYPKLTDSMLVVDGMYLGDNIWPSKQDLNEKLLAAAAEGLVREVDLMVEHGADLSSTSTNPGEEGLQALHLACWGGHTEVVTKLLDHGVDPRAVAAGREGVHWAAFGGHVTMLRLLKERGCDVTAASTPDGSTPLHLAADNGNLDATRWLVEQGAQIDAKDSNGRTPSDLAMVSEASDVYNYLVDRLKEEQLLEAAGAGNFEVTCRLIQDGVFVDAPSHKPQIRGRRALHQAADGGYTALVEVLMQAGADPTSDDNEGVLAVHLAAQAGHLEVLKLLLPHLPHGAAEVKGEKLVHWASKGGHVKILQYLKTTKCNLRAITKGTRRTALHLAADNGNLDAVKWLVKQGLSLDHRDANGFTAKDLAEHEGHREVELYLQQVLVPQRPKTTPQESRFLHAAANGQLQTVEELLDAKVNVDCKDQQGRSAVQLACAAGYLQVVKLLVARGAQLNDQDDEGNTAIHLAAEGGHLAILRVLRDNRCDLSSINNEDDSPLHTAARSSNVHVIKWLLNQGVEASETNAQGYTAEDIAREMKCKEAVSMLSTHTKTAGAGNLRTPDCRAKAHKKVHKHQQSSKNWPPSRPQSEEYTSGKSLSNHIPMPIGLQSIGNTCYMNSVIQCLYSTSKLTYYILHGCWREDINKESEYGGEVADAFHDVIYQLDSRGETIATVKALKTILGEHEVMFKGKEQQDAHDFYSLLLHALDTDLQGRGPSHIAELFIGRHKSDIMCEKTRTIISSVDELFSSLTLTVGSHRNSKHHCTLEELLTQYYRPCSIEWECPTCNTIHDCVRTTRIQHLPKTLVIHLSRVNQASGRYQSDRKQIVKFSKRLHSLDAFYVGTFKGEYSLYGVCSHMGTETNGHYTSTCRDWRLKSVWREFDDEIVTQLKGLAQDDRRYAHMLFYENLES